MSFQTFQNGILIILFGIRLVSSFSGSTYLDQFFLSTNHNHNKCRNKKKSWKWRRKILSICHQEKVTKNLESGKIRHIYYWIQICYKKSMIKLSVQYNLFVSKSKKNKYIHIEKILALILKQESIADDFLILILNLNLKK